MRLTLGYGIGSIVLAALVSWDVAYGQSSSPGTFYEKGYAGSPKIGGESLSNPQAPTPPLPRKGVTSPSRPPSSATPPQKAGQPTGNNQEYRMRVILYVSSKDKRHFEEVMRTAFKVATKHPSVLMAEVYHIGDYRNVPDSIKEQAAARKIFMAAIQQPPKHLNIESSPAWVLRDGKGIHIVEGITSVDKCIDSNGEYRAPERSMFEEPPTPTIGVKSF
jgi:hypothetical protein